MSDLATACPQCGVTAPIEDRFCEACGARLAPIADGDSEGARREIDAGPAAGLTNAGLAKHKNQDALYLQSVDDVVIAVVCDGVSSSVAADAAARVACTAAGRALSETVSTIGPEPAMRAAAAVAQRAVRGVPWAPETRLAAPSCTFVAAVWDGRQVTVGSIGDSRAYWIDGEAQQLLTVDDSWVQEQVDAGLMTEPEAAGDPRAHQITRWLGADAPEGPPAITVFVPQRPGRLVVCSDGLWNYASAAGDIAALVRASDSAAAPLHVARSLVDHALAKGGQDNITVAVVDITPTAEGTEP
jgi:serine/threonine protein phosphatase PrpC